MWQSGSIGRGVEAEDLFQIGSIGLLKAIDKFDLNYQVKLSTYAVPMISGEIKRFLRDDGMLKVSRSLKELSCKIFLAKEELLKKLGTGTDHRGNRRVPPGREGRSGVGAGVRHMKWIR